MDRPRVFLGGTCNDSTWREELIPKLTVDYFNPVVPNWTDAAAAIELQERQKCDLVLYTITPEMTGVYSIAEAVDDSNKRPTKTLFCILEWYPGMERSVRFNKQQLKSLDAVANMIIHNGGKVVRHLDEAAKVINQLVKLPASSKW